MARTNGRAPKRERLIATVPHGRWHITTFVGALRTSGFTAPVVIEGAINGETFPASARPFLAPTPSRGGMLVMDKLSVHKVAGMREAVEAKGATLLYLSPTRPASTPSNSSSPS